MLRRLALWSDLNLTTRFPVQGGLLRRTVASVHAVEDVSFTTWRVGGHILASAYD